MKILHVHNYHAGRGGMEVIYEYTTRLLRQGGHEVIELTLDSKSLDSPLKKLGAFGSSVYSVSAYRKTRELIEAHRPDLAHIHNLYPMFSTSVLSACRAEGVPVVMNVQDYKLTCPMGQHLRNGSICTKCLDGSVVWSAVHACKGGRLESGAYAISHGITRLRRAYQRGVDLFVTPARFTADYLVRAGYDRSRIVVIPNMSDLPPALSVKGDGEYAAFVGRISPEKGLNVLIDAARICNIPVRIAGGGTMANRDKLPENVRFVGSLSREALPEFYRGARFVVIPSIWQEVFSVVTVEAMGMGIPVIASKTGGLAEVFEHERSGIYVPSGDAEALAGAMRRLWDDPAACRRMGEAARQEAIERYSPEAFLERLTAAFERVLNQRGARTVESLAAAKQDHSENFV
jgi:glycosyltransferase involved in cell wall biosynthesis